MSAYQNEVDTSFLQSFHTLVVIEGVVNGICTLSLTGIHHIAVPRILTNTDRIKSQVLEVLDVALADLCVRQRINKPRWATRKVVDAANIPLLRRFRSTTVTIVL